MHRVAILVLALSAICPALHAQSGETQTAPPPTGQTHTMSPPIQILVTGCLKRDSDGGYYLSDQNGTKWLLSSKTVDLSGQVMHVVSVGGKPGTLAQPDPSSQTPGKSDAADSSAHALQVRSLKVVSNSCTR